MEEMLKCMLSIWLNHLDFEKNNSFWLYSEKYEALINSDIDQKISDSKEMVKVLCERLKEENIQSVLNVSDLYKEMLYFVTDYVSDKVKKEMKKKEPDQVLVEDLNKMLFDIGRTFKGLREKKLV